MRGRLFRQVWANTRGHLLRYIFGWASRGLSTCFMMSGIISEKNRVSVIRCPHEIAASWDMICQVNGRIFQCGLEKPTLTRVDASRKPFLFREQGVLSEPGPLGLRPALLGTSLRLEPPRLNPHGQGHPTLQCSVRMTPSSIRYVLVML